MFVVTLSYSLWLGIIALQTLLLVHLLMKRLVSSYPYFFFYLALAWTSTIAKWVTYHLASSYYPWAYWLGDAFMIMAGFLLVWEIFRQTFSLFPALRHRVKRSALLLVLMILTINVVLGASGTVPWDHPQFRAGGWLRFLQAAFLAGILATARQYALPLGRNVAGLALGFGLFVSLAAMSFVSLALLDIDLMQFSNAYAAAYLLALAIWIHALWVYVPNPIPERVGYLEQDYERLNVAVVSVLMQVRATLQKVLRA